MYRTARECCCVSDSEGILRLSIRRGVLLCFGQREGAECIGLRGSAVVYRIARECCCVSDSEGILSLSIRRECCCVSDSERVLSVSDNGGVLLCVGYRGSAECTGQRGSVASAVGCETSEEYRGRGRENTFFEVLLRAQ